jgi:hypothetical protein
MSAAAPIHSLEELWGELWASLASVLRSYSAVHGLSRNLQATIEHDQKLILARHGEKWLELKRIGATVQWKREDGSHGTLVLTESGRLQSHSGEEEMDLAAEQWARELMQ